MDAKTDHPKVKHPWWLGQAGLSLVELLASVGLMVVVAGSMSTLVGAAVRSKLVVAVRSADTRTARVTLEWMSERLRNAGLNVMPLDAAQVAFPARCKDRVVAQDAAYRPTAGAVYVSGEILNSNAVAGDEIITLGYYLGNDPGTGTPVVMESRNPCVGGGPTAAPLSDPKIRVTNLSFTYFGANGLQVTDLTNAAAIRGIRMIRVSLTVQGEEGRSGIQTLTMTRDVMLRNPEPNANNWKNPTEVGPEVGP